MVDQALEVRSNLKRASGSWSDEVMTSPQEEALLRSADLHTADNSSQQNLEELQRKHEEAVEASRAQRWKGQERWQGRENEDRRFVRILHPHTIFYRLRQAGVDARTESPELSLWTQGSDGQPAEVKVMRDTGRLWMNQESKVGRIGVNAWVRDENTGERTVKTVTTFQWPYGPEWSLFHCNAYGVVTAEKYRGWRTALLQLIFADVLTEAEVDRAFGPTVLNEASLFYRQQLQQRRNRKAGNLRAGTGL